MTDDPFCNEADPYPDAAPTVSRRALFVLPVGAAVLVGSCAAPTRLPCTPTQQGPSCTMRHCRHFRPT